MKKKKRRKLSSVYGHINGTEGLISVGKAYMPINMWIKSVTIDQVDIEHSDKQHAIRKQ